MPTRRDTIASEASGPAVQETGGFHRSGRGRRRDCPLPAGSLEAEEEVGALSCHLTFGLTGGGVDGGRSSRTKRVGGGGGGGGGACLFSATGLPFF